ncbi:MAG: oligosaccharide flippase family protein, partial [Myxococcota bacterium]|nr:oligosaccharide flippase family protein [Myxococcota bacterium]
MLDYIKKLVSTRLGHNILSGQIVVLLKFGLFFVAYPVYINFLDYEVYGVWLLLTSVLSLAQVGNLGVFQALAKLVSEECGQQNQQAVQSYLSSAILILLIIGVTIAIPILFGANAIAEIGGLQEEQRLLFVDFVPEIALLSILAMLAQANMGALAGLGRYDLANYIDISGKIAGFIVSLCLLLAGQLLLAMVAGQLITWVIIFVAGAHRISTIAKIRFFKTSSISTKQTKRLLTFGSKLLVGNFFNLLFGPINKFFLARFAGVDQIPIYEIAHNGGQQVRAVIEGGYRALMPEISSLAAQIDKASSAKLVLMRAKSMKIVLGLGTPLYLCLAAAANLIFQFWLGEALAPGQIEAFRWMLLASFINLINMVPYYFLLGLGRAGECSGIIVIQSLISILCTFAILFLSGALTV